ncbi:hypothetical protein VTJ04DRAFT_9857 [Mycothermus thermophilus]|uniref:uncharacterized protein n=1 Tax=Humicola insolens TaxID=85995 RepID=UPI0037439163
MSRSRAPLAIAAAAVGGIGYYLYSAGGNPKAAEKKFEGDARQLADRLKREIPPSRRDDIREKVDEAKDRADAAKSRAEAYYNETKADAARKADEAQTKAEESASKGKSALSGWFGGK